MMRLGQWVVLAMFAGLFILVIGALFFAPDPDESALPVNQFQAGMVGNPMVMTAAWQQAGTTPSQPPEAFFGQRMQLSEGHWQGMDAMPLSREIKLKLKLPLTLEGVLLGETTLAAAHSGLLAGDVLVAVERAPITTLEELQQASKKVAQRESVTLTAYRNGKLLNVVMRAPDGVLGFAQMETAPMIFASDQRPHTYRGPCTDCHAIGTTGHITPDPDGILLPAPAIRVGVMRPHSDRGPCQACHAITN